MSHWLQTWRHQLVSRCGISEPTPAPCLFVGLDDAWTVRFCLPRCCVKSSPSGTGFEINGVQLLPQQRSHFKIRNGDKWSKTILRYFLRYRHVDPFQSISGCPFQVAWSRSISAKKPSGQVPCSMVNYPNFIDLTAQKNAVRSENLPRFTNSKCFF